MATAAHAETHATPVSDGDPEEIPVTSAGNAGLDAQVVELGSHVTLEDVDDGLREEYELVGPSESNPAEGRLSVESPVGRAIVGHRRGDVVHAQAPRRIRHVRIAGLVRRATARRM